MEDGIDVGKALKELRKKNGVSQGDIFRATGLERGYLSKIENGKIKQPRITTIYKLAGFFNIKVSEFIRLAEEEHRSNV